jgi:hypothetical protein
LAKGLVGRRTERKLSTDQDDDTLWRINTISIRLPPEVIHLWSVARFTSVLSGDVGS